jgi:phosphoenolpyruvate carboxylase
MHNKRMSPYERIELLEAIRAQVQAAWRTDEIRRQKPTPQVGVLVCITVGVYL